MQTEKPAYSIADLEQCLGARPIKASGGQIEGFRKGWAVPIMNQGDRAHYYRRGTFDTAMSLCGKPADVRWLYGRGTYPKCQTCIRISRRMGLQ